MTSVEGDPKAPFPIATIRVVYIYIYSIKLAIIVVGDQKDPFSIATTLKCMGVGYFFSLNYSTLPLILTL